MSDLILANNIRKKIIKTGHKFGRVHFGGSLSMVDIMTFIFNNKFKKNVDRFILSKGHCALSLYAVLNEFGYMSDEDFCSFNIDGGEFPSHCVKNKTKGIELSSGSLGLGLSFAIGEALALKDKELYPNIFVLCGNGELNEGSFWESAMFAGSKKIVNVVLIIDSNNFQNDGCSDDILKINDYGSMIESFGWNVIRINGHNYNEMSKAFENFSKEKPNAIICTTIKGKGISFMENNGIWHHNNMTEDEYVQALKELGEN